jgi:hypothetical protein
MEQYSRHAVWDRSYNEIYIKKMLSLLFLLGPYNVPLYGFRSASRDSLTYNFTIDKITYNCWAGPDSRLIDITIKGMDIKLDTPGVWWDIAKQQLATELPKLESIVYSIQHQQDEISQAKLKEIEGYLLL